MKQILLILIFISAFEFTGSAQKYNSELLKSYSQSELKNFDTETLDILSYAIENALYYTEIPTGKNVQLTEIEVKNNSLKFTDFALKIAENTQYYKIKGTNQMLVIKSFNILKLQMQNRKK
ncbi:MAG: hypothetical protein ACKO6A_06130 [Bacteroidota bacterium]